MTGSEAIQQTTDEQQAAAQRAAEDQAWREAENARQAERAARLRARLSNDGT